MTANPSHVPNSRPLAAASSGPGTSMQPSTALSDREHGRAPVPSGSIQDSHLVLRDDAQDAEDDEEHEQHGREQREPYRACSCLQASRGPP